MMKRIRLFLILAFLLLATGGCEYDDSKLRGELESQSKRIESLEQQCARMNTNISSIQSILTALQNNDYVTSVTNVMQGNEVVGYKISFSKSPAITIYHGQNGTDGKDGSTPVIGVKADTDGVYYWTLNGEWLLDASGKKVLAQGRDGKDGAPGVGTPGQDGRDGTDGANGKDGIDGVDGRTPQLKIEDGYWFVSYDGTAWTKLGKAQGETGPQGPAGSDGDGFFNSVSVDNDGCTITFVLADGTSVVLPYGDRPIRFESELPQTITSGSRSVSVIINCDVDDIVSLSASLDAQDAVYTRAAGGWRSSLSVSKTAKRATITVVPYLSIENVLLTVTAVLDGGATYRISKILTAESDSGGDSAIDLSSSGTANSYIVTQAGKYSFPTVEGNTSAAVSPVASAEVLWESFGTATAPEVGDLISELAYSRGRVSFTASDKKGNAVIAAKDAAGDILWSWHIWLTDQPADQVYNNGAGIMMDRNLGATSANPGDVGALGLLYQWGRKDPFLGSSSISSDTQAKSVNSSSAVWSIAESDAFIGTIDYAIAYPTTFIIRHSSNYDWYYTGTSSTDNFRWQSSKTIYDPCPPGYRVPDGGGDGVWSKAFGTSDNFKEDAFDTTNRGFNFANTPGKKSLSSVSTCWYPAAGRLNYVSGALGGVRSDGYYWSCTPSSDGSKNAHLFYFFSNFLVSPSYNGYRADGHSVRCLQD